MILNHESKDGVVSNLGLLLTIIFVGFMLHGEPLYSQATQAQNIQTGNGISDRIVCFAINPPNKYAGTANGVYVSSIEGNNWKPIGNGLTNTNIRTLQIFSDAPSTLVAGTADGIFVSQNDGTSWEERTKGLTNRDVRSLATSKGKLFAGTTDGSLFLSTDRGASWSLMNNGIPNDAVVYSLHESGGNLYAGTQKGIFVSKDNGASWSQQ